MKKMSEETINYTIIDKDGKVVQNETFNDYDKLADHMLELAEKYYTGEFTEEDTIEISAFDKTGEMIYKDTATFGDTDNDLSNAFNITPEGIPTWVSAD